jgi:hypothetical protein
MVKKAPQIPLTWRVFVSSTARDFKTYRREIQSALRTVQATCFLSEEWVGGYQDTVEKCRDELTKSNGFILLLGRWYGSIPPANHGPPKSITHLEFDWAWQRWKSKKPRAIAVFEPEPGSKADIVLTKTAAQLLNTASTAFRKQHPTLLKTFHSEVKDSWRTVQFFKDIHHASLLAIASFSEWQKSALEEAIKATQNGVAKLSSLSPEQLGTLGRKPQLDAVELLISDLNASSAPAAAFLVSAQEDAGPRAFLMHLASSRRFDGEPRWVRPDPAMSDLRLLISSIALRLGLDSSRIQSARDLAAAVAAELASEQLVLFIERVPGAVSAFHTQFWTPFYDELKARSPKHRFIAVIGDYSGSAAVGQPHLCGPDFDQQNPEYGKLLLLPPFGPIRKPDVLRWLDQMKVEQSKRAAIADEVLQDGEGKPNGTPLLVFDRLRSQTLPIVGD